jgi:hypothetical protein
MIGNLSRSDLEMRIIIIIFGLLFFCFSSCTKSKNGLKDFTMVFMDEDICSDTINLDCIGYKGKGGYSGPFKCYKDSLLFLEGTYLNGEYDSVQRAYDSSDNMSKYYFYKSGYLVYSKTYDNSNILSCEMTPRIGYYRDTLDVNIFHSNIDSFSLLFKISVNDFKNQKDSIYTDQKHFVSEFSTAERDSVIYLEIQEINLTKNVIECKDYTKIVLHQ